MHTCIAHRNRYHLPQSQERHYCVHSMLRSRQQPTVSALFGHNVIPANRACVGESGGGTVVAATVYYYTVVVDLMGLPAGAEQAHLPQAKAAHIHATQKHLLDRLSAHARVRCAAALRTQCHAKRSVDAGKGDGEYSVHCVCVCVCACSVYIDSAVTSLITERRWALQQTQLVLVCNPHPH